jgi:hypothetical protein
MHVQKDLVINFKTAPKPRLPNPVPKHPPILPHRNRMKARSDVQSLKKYIRYKVCSVHQHFTQIVSKSRDSQCSIVANE